MCDKSGISEGEGGSVLGVNFWKIQRGGGVLGKIPSVGGGGYGYFLELHNIYHHITIIIVSFDFFFERLALRLTIMAWYPSVTVVS